MKTVPPPSRPINKFNESETETVKEAGMTHDVTYAEKLKKTF